jgi:lipopolysaccharide export system permease protein
MRLLDRYLLRELLIPLGYCLCGFLIILIAFDLVFQLHVYQENRLLVSDVAELYVVKIPDMLVFMLPIVLLLALLYALTNHARHHEITAIRAAGVGLWRLCSPYLIVGFLLSLAAFAMNELWVPDSADKQVQIMSRHQGNKDPVNKNIVTNFVFQNSRDGHIWQIGKIDFSSPACAMTAIKLLYTDSGTNLWIIAEHAERLNDTWVFYNVDEYDATKAGAQPDPVLQTNELVKPFSETPDQIKREVKFASRYNKPSIDSMEIPIAEILDYLNLHPHDLSAQKKRLLYTQLYGRLASPWTCLVVVLIAIPFGAASGRRNVFVGVAGSIVICFVYFVLLKLGLAMGTGGYLPPWMAAWLPNISFGIAGFWMILRVR